MWHHISRQALKGVTPRAFALSLSYEYGGDRQMAAMIHQLELGLLFTSGHLEMVPELGLVKNRSKEELCKLPSNA